MDAQAQLISTDLLSALVSACQPTDTQGRLPLHLQHARKRELRSAFYERLLTGHGNRTCHLPVPAALASRPPKAPEVFESQAAETDEDALANAFFEKSRDLFVATGADGLLQRLLELQGPMRSLQIVALLEGLADCGSQKAAPEAPGDALFRQLFSPRAGGASPEHSDDSDATAVFSSLLRAPVSKEPLTHGDLPQAAPSAPPSSLPFISFEDQFDDTDNAAASSLSSSLLPTPASFGTFMGLPSSLPPPPATSSQPEQADPASSPYPPLPPLESLQPTLVSVPALPPDAHHLLGDQARHSPDPPASQDGFNFLNEDPSALPSSSSSSLFSPARVLAELQSAASGEQGHGNGEASQLRVLLPLLRRMAAVITAKDAVSCLCAVPSRCFPLDDTDSASAPFSRRGLAEAIMTSPLVVALRSDSDKAVRKALTQAIRTAAEEAALRAEGMAARLAAAARHFRSVDATAKRLLQSADGSHPTSADGADTIGDRISRAVGLCLQRHLRQHCQAMMALIDTTMATDARAAATTLLELWTEKGAQQWAARLEELAAQPALQLRPVHGGLKLLEGLYRWLCALQRSDSFDDSDEQGKGQPPSRLALCSELFRAALQAYASAVGPLVAIQRASTVATVTSTLDKSSLPAFLLELQPSTASDLRRVLQSGSAASRLFAANVPASLLLGQLQAFPLPSWPAADGDYWAALGAAHKHATAAVSDGLQRYALGVLRRRGITGASTATPAFAAADALTVRFVSEGLVPSLLWAADEAFHGGAKDEQVVRKPAGTAMGRSGAGAGAAKGDQFQQEQQPKAAIPRRLQLQAASGAALREYRREQEQLVAAQLEAANRARKEEYDSLVAQAEEAKARKEKERQALKKEDEEYARSLKGGPGSPVRRIDGTIIPSYYQSFANAASPTATPSKKRDQAADGEQPDGETDDNDGDAAAEEKNDPAAALREHARRFLLEQYGAQIAQLASASSAINGADATESSSSIGDSSSNKGVLLALEALSSLGPSGAQVAEEAARALKLQAEWDSLRRQQQNQQQDQGVGEEGGSTDDDGQSGSPAPERGNQLTLLSALPTTKDRQELFRTAMRGQLGDILFRSLPELAVLPLPPSFYAQIRVTQPPGGRTSKKLRDALSPRPQEQKLESRESPRPAAGSFAGGLEEEDLDAFATPMKARGGFDAEDDGGDGTVRDDDEAEEDLHGGLLFRQKRPLMQPVGGASTLNVLSSSPTSPSSSSSMPAAGLSSTVFLGNDDASRPHVKVSQPAGGASTVSLRGDDTASGSSTTSVVVSQPAGGHSTMQDLLYGGDAAASSSSSVVLLQPSGGGAFTVQDLIYGVPNSNSEGARAAMPSPTGEGGPHEAAVEDDDSPPEPRTQVVVSQPPGGSSSIGSLLAQSDNAVADAASNFAASLASLKSKMALTAASGRVKDEDSAVGAARGKRRFAQEPGSALADGSPGSTSRALGGDYHRRGVDAEGAGDDDSESVATASGTITTVRVTQPSGGVSTVQHLMGAPHASRSSTALAARQQNLRLHVREESTADEESADGTAGGGAHAESLPPAEEPLSRLFYDEATMRGLDLSTKGAQFQPPRPDDSSFALVVSTPQRQALRSGEKRDRRTSASAPAVQAPGASNGSSRPAKRVPPCSLTVPAPHVLRMLYVTPLLCSASLSRAYGSLVVVLHCDLFHHYEALKQWMLFGENVALRAVVEALASSSPASPSPSSARASAVTLANKALSYACTEAGYWQAWRDSQDECFARVTARLGGNCASAASSDVATGADAADDADPRAAALLKEGQLLANAAGMVRGGTTASTAPSEWWVARVGKEAATALHDLTSSVRRDLRLSPAVANMNRFHYLSTSSSQQEPLLPVYDLDLHPLAMAATSAGDSITAGDAAVAPHRKSRENDNPLSFVLTPATMRRYQRIHMFLLRVKSCALAVQGLWAAVLAYTRQRGFARSAEAETMGPLYVFRREATLLLRCIEEHCAKQLHHDCYGHLVSSTLKRGLHSIEDLADVHDEATRMMLDRCLLPAGERGALEPAARNPALLSRDDLLRNGQERLEGLFSLTLEVCSEAKRSLSSTSKEGEASTASSFLAALPFKIQQLRTGIKVLAAGVKRIATVTTMHGSTEALEELQHKLEGLLPPAH